MSDTVDKVLDYLGEKPRKSAPAPRPAAQAPRRKPSARKPAALKAHAGATMVGKSLRAPQLPGRVVARLAAKLRVPPEVLLYVSDISERTFQRRQANQELLTEAESDRVLRIARVAFEAERVFGNADKAGRWLSAVNRILGAKPLDLLATDAGARDVEYELVRIDHGDFA